MGSFSLAQKISSSPASFWLSAFKFEALELFGIEALKFKPSAEFAALKFKACAPQEFKPPLELCSFLEFKAPLEFEPSLEFKSLLEFSSPL